MSSISWPLTRPRLEDAVSAERAQAVPSLESGWGCGRGWRPGISVGQWVLDGDNIVEVVVDDTSPEQFPEGTDEVGRHFREVGDGFVADPLSLPP
ncbi:MAG: hypothetical protein OXC57_04840 [Rhodobacteraceae bacterium]|nr:hypothetical protein [Paracoccaceae bacterium]